MRVKFAEMLKQLSNFVRSQILSKSTSLQLKLHFKATGGSDQHFEAKNFMDHFKPNFRGKHDGTLKKHPTACVLVKNEVN